MSRSKGRNVPDPAEPDRAPKRHRVEFSTKHVFTGLFALVLVLAWMFMLGVLAGRGLPLIDSEDLSLRAHLVRFIGLDKEVAPERPDAAETWDSPKKMLETLSYYEDLAQKESPPAPETDQPAPAAPQPRNSSKTSPAEKTPATPDASKAGGKDKAAPPKTAKETPKEATKEAAKEAVKEAPPPEIAAGHFTLLIASLRDAENAQKLVEQLKSKGYPSRLEPLDLQESGRWNRILVGSFQSREEALRFAADFNRKERLEGLVIREPH
ncbi:MAG TPA: SPOR domain-containing protein [Syntrophobacteraceae bacterium]|nr:SPOR domain-containing protein [Syntrophobacteraceae bacterium]